MANWIRSFSCLSTNRISSISRLSTKRIHFFRAFSSTMQHFYLQKILLESSTNPKSTKGNKKWQTSYSRIAQTDALERSGLDMQKFDQGSIPVRRMLSEAYCGIEGIRVNAVDAMKEKVYARILEHIQIKGYPSEASIGFRDLNVNDLVLYILGPIMFDFQKETGREIKLRREIELVSSDSPTGGFEEFVIVDTISTTETSFILIIESKQTTLGHGIRQCLLAMYDMFSHNGGGKAYGFVTTGELWRMIRYDGTKFQMTEIFHCLFGEIGQQKSRWMEEYSVVVECILVALHSGGILKGEGGGESGGERGSERGSE
ncbi:hypothetical protein B9Z19DRAFT_1063653 [Tuber borchii]|uniref:Uncharacterized protein n=1 Tax=Tuber borchii TaxID=42251 RepID=A0A2T6ZXH0_TUBBO|nr:hypothetical protein B9Z19DRAFT_1063653 [Tuber borchii]